ncbi:hypothetical protein GCK72_007222 [Caenorhabditis remanei]|nr:hypothetical protein GCK72_007222 [Caenorhabditis remanei]KAF1767263.1 hypothetical protein GCK72_007222 [Caenorhabditis remanei]
MAKDSGNEEKKRKKSQKDKIKPKEKDSSTTPETSSDHFSADSQTFLVKTTVAEDLSAYKDAQVQRKCNIL